MSDLDKLMKKLKDKPKKETPKVEEVSTPEILNAPKVVKEVEEMVEETKDPDEDFDEVDEAVDEAVNSGGLDEVEETPTEEEKVEESEPIPAHEGSDPIIEGEIAVLQNNGVFRRELLLTLKELVGVQKIQTEALIKCLEVFKNAKE